VQPRSDAVTGSEPGRCEGVPAGLDPAPSDLLTAVDRGWPVFPLRPGSKLPALGKWEQRAITDPARVRAFLARHPGANLGVATGPAGLLVVDCDAAKGTPPAEWALPGIHDGADVLMHLAEQHGGTSWATVIDTFTVATPSGGKHYYFGAPAVTLRNTAGRIGWCIDSRAAGGFVVAPGSVVDGRPYSVIHGGDVRPAPAWLVRLLTERPTRQNVPMVRTVGTRPVNRTAYTEAAMRSEISSVLAAPAGQRNTTLNRAAFSLGTLVATGDLDRTAVLIALHRAGEHVGLGDDEVRATVASGLRSGAEQPRRVA